MSIPYSIRIDPKLKAAGETLAAESDHSLAWLLKRLLKEHLAKRKSRVTPTGGREGVGHEPPR